MATSTRPARDAHLLATLAESLEPNEPPFYVSAAPNGSPDGWYWTPAGEERPRFLGRNVTWAEKRLLEFLRP